jgi:hypothetical protein
MQGEIDGASGQSFGDMTEQCEVGRPGKDETARTPLFIDALLQRDEQSRAALNFVENGGAFQQGFRIGLRRCQRGKIVECAVGN